MTDRSDQQLLSEYQLGDSQAAFAELVRRHVDFVHSVAVRMLGDQHLAQDVTQGVFIALAREATTLQDRPILAGWLHRTSRNLAAKIVRTEVRRRTRELEAAARLGPDPEATWEQIAPQLDAALGQLDEVDRDALLLRYFAGRSAREIGTTLGLGEAAAQKRILRALDRLRGVLVDRGLAVPATSLAGGLLLQAVQAAPATLVGTILGGWVPSGAVGSTAVLMGLNIMSSIQLKLALVAVVAVGVATTMVRQQTQIQTLRAEAARLRAEPVTPAPAETEASGARLVAPPSEELLRLRGEVARLRSQQMEVARLQAENQRLRMAANAPVKPPPALNGEEFLAANATRAGVVQTASGLQYQVIAAGSGRTPKLTDTVKVHYHGTLLDGTVFDSSVARGEALKFPVGGVIPGWSEALQLMREGDKWQLFVPAGLAYGDKGAGDKIAPNSLLMFEVELLEIEPAKGE